MIYIIIFLLLMFFSFLEMFCKCKINKRIFIILFLIMAVVASLRWEVGTDFNQYQRLFEYCITSKDKSNVELSFYLISNISKNFNLVLLIYSFLSCTFFSLFIKDLKFPYSSLLIFYSFTFFSYTMGRMRQSLAISLCLYSLIMIKKNKGFKSIIPIIFAFLFHKSAIIFILCIFLNKICLSKKFMIISSLVSVVLCFLHFDLIIVEVIKKIPLISGYADYLTVDSEYSYFSFSILNFRRLFLLFAFVFFIGKKSENYLYLKLFYTGTIMFYLFKDFPVVSERISFYFNVIEIVLIPILVSNFKKFPLFAGTIIMHLYSLYYFVSMISLDANDSFNRPYLPYKTFFSEVTDASYLLLYVSILIISSLFFLVIQKKFILKKNSYSVIQTTNYN